MFFAIAVLFVALAIIGFSCGIAEERLRTHDCAVAGRHKDAKRFEALPIKPGSRRGLVSDEVQRLEVPGGWLVRSSTGALVVINDPEHKWGRDTDATLR